MELFISHRSALEYWRLHGNTLGSSLRRQYRRKLPASPPDTSSLHSGKTLGLSLPLNVMVANPDARRVSRITRPHVYRGPVPDSSFIPVADGLVVSSPEFCFLQMACVLSLIELIELGFELCGAYSLSETSIVSEHPDSTKKGFYNRPPLTNIKKLRAFVARMAGARGYKRASRALRHITDGSASPMETILVMLLSLPYKQGGYGLPIPELNARIIPAKSARRSASKIYYSCDLFWPDVNVAAEYDSDMFHTGAERISSDSRRRNTLASIGILVITVTNQQIRSIVEFGKIAHLLAASMGKRLRYKKQGFLAAQRKLRGLLL